jgi:hypothetical protein
MRPSNGILAVLLHAHNKGRPSNLQARIEQNQPKKPLPTASELSPTVFKPNSRDPNEPTKIEVKNPTKRTRKIVRGIIHLLARLHQIPLAR